MTIEEILSDVGAIFVDVLDDEAVVIGLGTTARDVPGWDSLAHIQLVVAIEKRFKIRFTAAEVRGFKNVGEMCQSIQGKTGKE
jgi:acyl carrier protein